MSSLASWTQRTSLRSFHVAARRDFFQMRHQSPWKICLWWRTPHGDWCYHPSSTDFLLFLVLCLGWVVSVFCHSSKNNVDSSVEKSWDPTLDPNFKIKHDRKTTRKKQLIFNNVVSKLMSQVDLSILNDNSIIIQHWEQSSKKHKKIKLLIVGCYFSDFLDQRRSPFTDHDQTNNLASQNINQPLDFIFSLML